MELLKAKKKTWLGFSSFISKDLIQEFNAEVLVVPNFVDPKMYPQYSF